MTEAVVRQRPFIPNIRVVGVGGAGGNVIAHMVRQGVNGVELIACNTDSQALDRTRAEHRILLGANERRGRGAGANPDVGRQSALESEEALRGALAETDLVFTAVGLGGGTGTGAAPVVARLARQQAALSVAVVTLPFTFEGKRRGQIARAGLEELAREVDMILVIPNDRLVEITSRNTSLLEAFSMVDQVMVDVISGITDLITNVGLINVDFADIRTVMENRGGGVIGKGEGSGEDRLQQAMEAALSNPLMGDVDLRGAKGVLVHVMGNEELGLMELNSAMEAIGERMSEDANLIFGATTHERMGNSVSLMLIATGVQSPFMPGG